MLFGGSRLGFWRNLPNVLRFVPGKNPMSFWDSQQAPAEPNSYAQFTFGSDGSITLQENSIATPNYDYSTQWLETVTSGAGSNYEIRAYMTTVNRSSAARTDYTMFGNFESPSQGNYTSWYNLGTDRIFNVAMDSSAGPMDTIGITALIEIGMAGTSTAIISETFQLVIGAA
jgi:hypothetical protein